ncbi:dTMP kinase [Paracandidimonas soli]|uniref:dTMP kinase n=1 Tax=Paracandidimonas soli TaxID=1917182 RepID=UPI003DA6EA9F
MKQISRGRFITLEGVDGAGKSTHLQWLEEQLAATGARVLSTREPGGTALGETLRELLLTRPMTLETETLLMFAARCEHLRTVIEPALADGIWVVCDRFTDASYAYQGGGRELGAQRIAVLEDWVHPDLQPDCTFLFDVPLEVARQRLENGRNLDRFEQENADFFQRTRAAYHARAQQHPGRFHIIDSTRSIAQIREQIAGILAQLRPGKQG